MRVSGLYYQSGWGGKPNFDKASEYFQKGADAGDHVCWVFLAKLRQDTPELTTHYWANYLNSTKYSTYHLDAQLTLDFILEYIDQDPEILSKFISQLNSYKIEIKNEIERQIDREKEKEDSIKLPKLQLALDWIFYSFEFK